MVNTIDEKYKKYQDLYAGQKNNAITTVNNAAKAESDSVSQIYGNQIETTKKEYDDLYRQNAIQKYVNEKQIAENMANGGITDSGLNRTQQTANQLYYANTKNKIDIKLTDTVNAIRDILNSKLTQIENDRAGSVANIEKSYDDAAMSAAQNEYDTEYKAETERYKAALKALSNNNGTNNIYTFLRSTTENDTSVNVFRDSNGKEVKVGIGVNPYTGTQNTIVGNGDKKWDDVKNNTKLTDAQKAAAIYGTFKTNTYQPKGIVYKGKHYGTITAIGSTDVFGKNQNVWSTSGSTGVRYWIWYGAENRYIQIDKDAFNNSDGTIMIV